MASALRAEGIPVATGLPRLMCDHPMFKRKIAFGNRHYPWGEAVYRGKVDYHSLILPNARRLQDEEYFGFFQLGWPTTQEDLDDIIQALTKIMANKNIAQIHFLL